MVVDDARRYARHMQAGKPRSNASRTEGSRGNLPRSGVGRPRGEATPEARAAAQADAKADSKADAKAKARATPTRRPASIAVEKRATAEAAAATMTIECAAGTLVVGRRAGALVADWKVDRGCVAPAGAGDCEAAALAGALRKALLARDESGLARFDEGAGTAFQRSVWRACRAIPHGQTKTYGELARALGLARGGARAVGQALRRNPLPIVVPCHRVVSAAGLGGYAGTTTGALAKVKQTLLELEREA